MRLETKRLILRPWRKGDIPDLIDGLNNLAVARWLAFVPHPYTTAVATKWIDYCSQIAKTGRGRRAYEFAIELKTEKKVIGGVSLNRIDPIHGTAGGGIWINAAYQGRGYGSEASAEKIRFAFEDLNLRRLENGFFPGNESSFQMQKKFGYRVEGTRRKAFRCMADGKLKDECNTALLREQWRPKGFGKSSGRYDACETLSALQIFTVALLLFRV
jgi:ribosomal-protein-alanine N-acetyltransferase